MHRIHRHTISFKHAFEGMMWAFRTQPNYAIHAFLSFLSLVGTYFFRLSYSEFLIILTLITIGFAIETINTAIEKVCDAITKDLDDDIKTAKDVAAGAMLIYAIGAATIACIIFLPKILYLFNYN